MSNTYFSTSVNVELERTPGEAAVSGTNGGDRRGTNSPPVFPPTNSSPDGTDNNDCLPITQNVLVGFGKLRALLQPKHASLESNIGYIKGFAEYWDNSTGKALFYPRIKSFSRQNPYRLHQLNSQCAGRSASKMLKLASVLVGMRITDLTLTCPKPISDYLASIGEKSAKVAFWSMEKRFWALMVENGLAGEGFTRRVNMHTWKSEKPVEAHYHAHELIPNYEEAEEAYDFKARPFKKLESGGYGTWSSAELNVVKAIWLLVNLNYAVQHRISAFEYQNELRAVSRDAGVEGIAKLIACLSRLKEVDESVQGLIDVFVGYVRLEADGDKGKSGFIHKLAYNGRHPIEDYTYYSNKHLDCPDPPQFIANYSNKARVFGWWKRITAIMKELGVDAVAGDEKLSPYTTKPMDYIRGSMMRVEVLLNSDNPLVFLDIVGKKVIEREPTASDIEWLKYADFNRLGGSPS